jgi:predicted short-subunit dehydrogenase-like oxidoreductase (DUF2520 family)
VITFRVIGPGRAGQSLAAALDADAGFELRGVLGRNDLPDAAASGVDLLVIATPDDQVGRVADSIVPIGSTTVCHLSGSLGLDVLGSHHRRGSIHPLIPLPNPERGAERLRSGITFAVAGDPVTLDVVAALGGRAMTVDDGDRDAYHATASIAANHLVALIGQVERLAASTGLPLDAFADLMQAAMDDALDLGPKQALTGPAARGDWDTVERHRSALSSLSGHRTELAAYDAMVGLARRLRLGSEPSPAVEPIDVPDAIDVAEAIDAARSLDLVDSVSGERVA